MAAVVRPIGISTHPHIMKDTPAHSNSCSSIVSSNKSQEIACLLRSLDVLCSSQSLLSPSNSTISSFKAIDATDSSLGKHVGILLVRKDNPALSFSPAPAPANFTVNTILHSTAIESTPARTIDKRTRWGPVKVTAVLPQVSKEYDPEHPDL